MAIDERQRTEITEGLARPKLVPDAIFPDHEFTAHDRKRYRLSEIQGSDPMILILSRGSFCPKDARQHKIMSDFYPQITPPERSGPSSRTRSGSCRRSSGSRSTPIRTTTR